LEGSPNGRKIQHLRSIGFEVVAPDGRGLPLASRLVDLERVTRGQGILLIGSSYGGLAAAHLAMLHPERFIGVLLLAPALHHSEPPVVDGAGLRPPSGVPTIVIHGLSDQVVPIEGSRRYAHSGATLLEVDDDHSLAASLADIAEAVHGLLSMQP
jgi:pimeloyl-ACP methyl ester carboxylesterase